VRKHLRLSKVLAGSGSLFRTVMIVGIGFVILYPLLVQISSAFMAPADLNDPTVHWIPKHTTLENFQKAVDALKYGRAFRNTLLLSLTVSVVQLVSCTFVGYGFARYHFPGKRLLMGLVILTLIVPPQMIMVPLFLNFRFFNPLGLLGNGVNLLGSFWPYLMMGITGTGVKNALFIYITRQYFAGMSESLEEAAYIDGAGSIRTFFQVMVPNAVPVLVVVFLFSFVWIWNDMFYAQMFLTGTANLALGIADLPILTRYLYGDHERNTLIHNAATLLYIAPMLLVYAFLQRFFIESVEKTGLVG
jgi:multiple sugar transport system permease protein